MEKTVACTLGGKEFGADSRLLQFLHHFQRLRIRNDPILGAV